MGRVNYPMTFPTPSMLETISSVGVRTTYPDSMVQKKKRNTYPGSGIHVCPVAQEDAYDVCLVGAGGQMERGLAADSGEVWVGVVLDQEDDNVHVPHERCHVKWSQARLERKDSGNLLISVLIILGPLRTTNKRGKINLVICHIKIVILTLMLLVANLANTK